MASSQPMILGEFRRSVDDRFRLSVPTDLAGPLRRRRPRLHSGEGTARSVELVECCEVERAARQVP